MKRNPNKVTRRNQRDQRDQMELDLEREPKRSPPPPIEARTGNQKRYMSAIKSFMVTLGLGPAGTGKTYIAGSLACEYLMDRKYDRIVITRPAVEAEEELGFLPGEVEDKYAPYIAPFRDVLDERLGKSHVDNLLKLGRIQAQPFAYMRGRTFKNAVVILDEAQNATPKQMKLFLTRIGENCKVIINGDETQKDIRGLSGLEDAAARLAWIPSVKVIRFNKSDVVRSGFVGDVLDAYEEKPA